MAPRKKTTKPSKARGAARKTGKPTKKETSALTAPCLYLGCFFLDTYGEHDHTGTFQMVIEASSPEQAVERFRTRLRAINRIGSVLASPNTIYLEGFLPLTGSIKEGILVNYESRPTPDPPDYQLTNMMPEQGIEGPRSYQLTYDDKEGIQPFIDFGGAAHLRAVEAAKRALQKSSWPASPPKPRLSTEEREKARLHATARRGQAAEAEAKKKERQAAAAAKARRDLALKETLSELRAEAQKGK